MQQQNHVTHVIDYYLCNTALPARKISGLIGCSPSVIDRRHRSAPAFVREQRKARQDERKAARRAEEAKTLRQAQELREQGATFQQIAEVVGRGVHWVSAHTSSSCPAGLREAEREGIVEAYKQPGASVRTVAALTGVDHNTVAEIVRAAGATKPPGEWRKPRPSTGPRKPRQPRNPKLVRAVVALRERGFRYREIKELLGVRIGTASRWVRKYGGSAQNLTHRENGGEGSPAV